MSQEFEAPLLQQSIRVRNPITILFKYTIFRRTAHASLVLFNRTLPNILYGSAQSYLAIFEHSNLSQRTIFSGSFTEWLIHRLVNSSLLHNNSSCSWSLLLFLKFTTNDVRSWQFLMIFCFATNRYNCCGYFLIKLFIQFIDFDKNEFVRTVFLIKTLYSFEYACISNPIITNDLAKLCVK